MVDFKSGLFHKFQQEQVGDVEDLGLKFERLGDQVHAFDGPLGVLVVLLGFVQVESLVLLFEEFVLADV